MKKLKLSIDITRFKNEIEDREEFERELLDYLQDLDLAKIESMDYEIDEELYDDFLDEELDFN